MEKLTVDKAISILSEKAKMDALLAILVQKGICTTQEYQSTLKAVIESYFNEVKINNMDIGFSKEEVLEKLNLK